jgi:hypothetical protein
MSARDRAALAALVAEYRGAITRLPGGPRLKTVKRKAFRRGGYVRDYQGRSDERVRELLDNVTDDALRALHIPHAMRRAIRNAVKKHAAGNVGDKMTIDPALFAAFPIELQAEIAENVFRKDFTPITVPASEKVAAVGGQS